MRADRFELVPDHRPGPLETLIALEEEAEIMARLELARRMQAERRRSAPRPPAPTRPAPSRKAPVATVRLLRPFKHHERGEVIAVRTGLAANLVAARAAVATG